jgi:Flp pilus assembly protein TadD
MDQIRFLIMTVIIVALAAMSFARSSIYENEVTLYTDIVSSSPNKARPHNNLGDALKKAGRFEEAGPHFERALALQPDYPDALNNLATIYNSSGRKEEAMRLLSQALALNPGHLQARSNLAITFYERGMPNEASQQYAIIIDLAPYSKEGVFARKMLSMIQRRAFP